MSKLSLLTALQLELRSIGFGDHEQVRAFCTAFERDAALFVADRPTPFPKASRVLHPAGPPAIGAYLGAELVGVVRLEPSGPSGARLMVAVRRPWRRSGVATRLIRRAANDPQAIPMQQATMIVGRDNRAALALARACGMERLDRLGADGEAAVELTLVLGRPTVRCA